MSDLGLTSDEAAALISLTQSHVHVLVAALALVVYDTILSFSQEFRCIWQRKLGTGTILYLVIRYGTIINIALQVLDGSGVTNVVIGCKGLSFTSYIVDIICLFSYAIFNCLRIWSICQHQWVPTLLVFTLGMFDPAINIYAYSINFLGSYLAVPSGPLAGCWVESDTISYIYLGVITRTISVAADAAVLGFTLWKTVYIIKMDKAVRVSSKLTTTLAYNGSIQFGILLIVNILAVILDVLSVATDGEGAKASVFIYMQNVITSIVLSHFILSLRSIYHTTNNFTHPPSKNSSVLFASAVEGNMGATLSASWADVEESEDTHYSEYPFSIGLVDTKEFIERDNMEEVSEVSPPDTMDIAEEPSTHGVISVVHRAGV